MDEPSDAAVIAASLTEPARFGTIFDRHASVLRRYLIRRLGPDDAGGDPAEAVSAAVDAAHRWARVAAAVTALPDPERDALVLRVWEGLGYDQIATALGIPVGTVRSRINRARRRLREPAAPVGRQRGDHVVGPVRGGSPHER